MQTAYAPLLCASVLMGALSAGATPPPMSAPAEDAALLDRVRALLNDEGLGADTVRVGVKHGIITMSGRAPSIGVVERATEIAVGVDGVQRVDSFIVVGRSVLTDERIAENVGAALRADPALRLQRIDVRVQQGNALVTGRVPSWPLSLWASRVVGNITGVRRVDNTVVVVSGARWDPQLARDIRDRVLWDVRLADSQLVFEAKGGVVTARGTVDALYDARLIEDIARRCGARAVSLTDVVVRRAPAYVDASVPAPARTERAIADAIRAAIALHAHVEPKKVGVGVRDGVATLRGEVPLLAVRRAVLESARFIVGVREVKDELTVVPAAFVPPAALRDAVKQAVETSYGVSPGDISWSVVAGHVTLGGRARSVRQREIIVAQVAALEGVIELQDDIIVERTARTVSDAALRARIVRQLRFSPVVDAQNIQVSVREGEVRLTGMVDSQFESDEATEDAVASGAVRLRNQLVVLDGSRPQP